MMSFFLPTGGATHTTALLVTDNKVSANKSRTIQGTLTKREGLVRLTSSLRQLVS
jgi:hypothetical protein